MSVSEVQMLCFMVETMSYDYKSHTSSIVNKAGNEILINQLTTLLIKYLQLT